MSSLRAYMYVHTKHSSLLRGYINHNGILENERLFSFVYAQSTPVSVVPLTPPTLVLYRTSQITVNYKAI